MFCRPAQNPFDFLLNIRTRTRSLHVTIWSQIFTGMKQAAQQASATFTGLAKLQIPYLVGVCVEDMFARFWNASQWNVIDLLRT